MGHSLAKIEVSAHHANAAINNSRTDIFGRRPSLASRIVSAGVSHWYDTEANRDDDANEGDGVLSHPMTRDQAHRYLDTDKGFEDARTQSLVIPIVADADAKTVTKKVKVPVEEVLSAPHRDIYSHITETVDGLASFKVLEAPRRLKAVAVSKPGAARTEYVVMHYDRVLSSHTTLAEARQAGLAAVERPHTYLEHLSVQARQVKGDSPKLITFEQPYAKGAHYLVEVTTAEAKPNAPIISYLVAFDYHH